MGLIKEFKEFANKGSFLDLAVGVIIGGAVGKVITTLVDKILMPPIGWLMGDKAISQYFVSLDRKNYASLDEAITAGAPVIGYGEFVQELINFIIIMFVIFLLVRTVNKFRKKQEEVPAGPSQEDLLAEIRDLLKK